MSSFTDDQKIMGFAMMKYLAGMKSPEADAAASSLSSVFGVSLESSDDFKSMSVYPQGITEIFTAGMKALDVKTYDQALSSVEGPQFDAFVESVTKKNIYKDLQPGTVEYMDVHSKVIAKYVQKKSGNLKSKRVIDAEMEEKADKKKQEGNNAVQKQNYNAAVRLYTEAIELLPDGPNSHIYYSNRAAAYCYLNSYELAVEDCLASTKLNDSYCKAWTRLGLSYYQLEQYDKAAEAYQRCVQLEPKIKGHKESLASAKQKFAEQRTSSGPGSSNSSGGGGLSDMMNNPDLASMMGGEGGLSALMKNPQMMKMAGWQKR